MKHQRITTMLSYGGIPFYKYANQQNNERGKGIVPLVNVPDELVT